MRSKRTQTLKFISLTAGVIVLLVAFQNCGQSLGEGFALNSSLQQANEGSLGNTSGDSSNSGVLESTGDLCEDQLYAKFASGYYVFLRNSCASCHDGSHEAPAFAAKNTLTSYQVFKDKGYQVVSSNAVSPNHNPPATGTHNSGVIDSLMKDWEAAQEVWLQCKGTNSEDASIVTLNKVNVAIVNNKANAAYWGTLIWDLTSDRPASDVKFPLSISVQAQVAKVGGKEVGYAVKNPTMSVTAGTAKYRVKGLFFYVNNKLVDSATVYRDINAVVCPGGALNLAPTGNAQLIVMSPTSTTDQFALQLTSVTLAEDTAVCGISSADPAPVDTTPALVTFADLTATTGTLNVFRTQCFSCHQGTGSSAGLDLSNYMASKAAANKILLRINDATNPMPRSGLMSSQMRSIIEKWVTTGTPQN